MVNSKKSGQTVIRGEKTDLWALGVTFYQLVTGELPFASAKNPFELREAIMNLDIDFLRIKRPEIRKVIMSLLTEDPDKRATIEELRNTAWVTLNGTEEIDLTKTDFVPEVVTPLENDCSTPTHSFGNY